MKTQRWLAGLAGAVLAGGLVTAPAAHAGTNGYTQRNLVADRPGRAEKVDPNLVNAWGMSRAPGGPIWVSNYGSDTSTIYDGATNGGPVNIEPLVVHIAGGAPTGQVYNDTNGFKVSGQNTLFIFAGEGGIISAWYPGLTTSIQTAQAPGAVYKGLAIDHLAGGPLLLAANFHDNRIDVYDKTFNRMPSTGMFVDPNLPAGYAPFNVAEIHQHIYVTYAQQDADRHDDVPGPGHGYVDVYNQSGRMLNRLVSQGVLNSPWGLTIAPPNFGRFSNDLLVGNFGDGRINVFDPDTGSPLGSLRDRSGHPLTIDGLWGLLVGDPGSGGSQSVWFSAGPNEEAHGLLGLISAN